MIDEYIELIQRQRKDGVIAMTIDEAVEILNRVKWRNRTDWLEAGGSAACGVGEAALKSQGGPSHHLQGVDSMKKPTPEILDKITDVVLAYRPKSKKPKRKKKSRKAKK